MRSISLLTDGIFPYVVGGMQKHSYYLAKYFAKNKIKVDLYHFNASELDIDKLELFTTDEKEFITPIVLEFPSAGHLPGHYLKESYLFSSLIYEALKKRPATDIIYAKGFSGWKSIEEKKKGLALPPIGVNFHGYEMFQVAYGLRSNISKFFLKGPVQFNSRNADIVFSYGGKITELIRGLGVEQEHILEIPTGIEESWISKEAIVPKSIRKFIFIGRNERRKGLPELHTIIKNKLNGLNFSFDIVGPIPEKERINVANVKYHGMVNAEEKMKILLRDADVLVCPSHSEGMPNVIMEAMASGLAVIATNVGAVPCMVNEKNGWLLNAGDVNGIEQAIRTAISMPAGDLQKMKMNSIKKVEEEFRWNELIKVTIAKIDEKIKG